MKEGKVGVETNVMGPDLEIPDESSDTKIRGFHVYILHETLYLAHEAVILYSLP